MSVYHQIITEATGITNAEHVKLIEDCMRHDIFHSTLDWQTREELEYAARDAVDMLKEEGLLP